MRTKITIFTILFGIGISCMAFANDSQEKEVEAGNGSKMKVWTANLKDIYPEVDKKPATRRDIIAGQIYSAFIAKYDVNAFKGGSYTVSANLLFKENGTELMKASICAADELIKQLDAAAAAAEAAREKN